MNGWISDWIFGVTSISRRREVLFNSHETETQLLDFVFLHFPPLDRCTILSGCSTDYIRRFDRMDHELKLYYGIYKAYSTRHFLVDRNKKPGNKISNYKGSNRQIVLKIGQMISNIPMLNSTEPIKILSNRLEILKDISKGEN